MIYLKIQTNRAKLKEIIGQFSVGITDEETFIAPRPLPRENFKFYVGYACVYDSSKNHKLLSNLKNHSIMDEQSYISTIAEIEYSWRVPKQSV
jgi:hypothetical protein